MKKALTFITVIVGLVYFSPLHGQTKKELNKKIEVLEKAISRAQDDINALKEDVIDLQKELSIIRTENDFLKQKNVNHPDYLVNQPKYGPGRGTGNMGAGISNSLSGRTATSTPKPGFSGREDGIVVVKITVDRNGRVTAAEPGQRGTTTMNSELHDAAKRAALQSKFNVDENAPAFQTGTITYRFIIQNQ
jgi:hypothetical protein